MFVIATMVLLAQACSIDGEVATDSQPPTLELTDSEYQSFLTNSSLDDTSLSLTPAERSCAEATLFADPAFVDRVVTARGLIQVHGDDQATILISVLDCAPDALNQSLSLSDDPAGDEMSHCLIEWLGPDNQVRHEAVAGWIQAGNDAPVPARNVDPAADLFDACIPNKLMQWLLESQLTTQAGLGDAVDVGCITKLLEGPSKRELARALITNDATGMLLSCIDMGRFFFNQIRLEFGLELSEDTIACLTSTFEATNIGDRPDEGTALIGWILQIDDCFTSEELGVLRRSD